MLGSVAVTAALMLGIYAIVTTPDHGWASAHTLVYGGAGLALMALFFALQARLANPIMPLRILRVQGLASTSIVRGLLATGLFSTFFLGALYLERVRGYSALRTGVAFLPLSLAVGVLSAGITARLMSRFGARRVMLPGLAADGARAAADVARRRALELLPRPCSPRSLILGLGAGLAFIPLLAIAMAHVPNADAGLASGIVNVSLQMSGARRPRRPRHDLDRPRALARRRRARPADALTSGYQLAFLVGAACVALGAVLALVGWAARAPAARFRRVVPRASGCQLTGGENPRRHWRTMTGPMAVPPLPGLWNWPNPLPESEFDGGARRPGLRRLQGRRERRRDRAHRLVRGRAGRGAPRRRHGRLAVRAHVGDSGGRRTRRQPRLADRPGRPHQAADQGSARVRRHRRLRRLSRPGAPSTTAR